MNPPVVLYTLNREKGILERMAYLENAVNVEYSLVANDIASCGFSLPATDPKGKYLQHGVLVELWDAGEQVGLFKLATRKRRKSSEGIFFDVTCKHIISTLQEKVLFSVNEYTGHTISEVISYILSTEEEGKAKQSDWVLGRCDFSDIVIDYLFENVTLYEALYSIPHDWTTPYLWTYDTTAYPWKVNLIKPSDDVKSEIRTGKNLISLTVSEDFQQLRNKIYGLGKGEGINQLNLMYAEDLEDPDTPRNGHYYVTDEESIQRYGAVYEGIYTDRSLEKQPLLLLAAKKYLQEYSGDHPTYDVQAVDLYSETRSPLDHFRVGDMCRVVETELGISYEGRILQVSKKDMIGDPGNAQLVVGYPGYDLIYMLKQMRQTDSTEETASQGATNIYPYSFVDNCDPTHPLELDFVLPDDLIYINKCDLYCKVENFRAYEQGAASGGGDTSGSGNLTTTENSGGQTISQSSTTSSASGGASAPTSEVNMDPVVAEDDGFPLTRWSSMSELAWGTDQPLSWPVYGTTGQTIGDISVLRHWHPEMSHSHKVNIPSHSHGISHTHTLPSHAHSIKSHTHSLPTHTHDLNYGIYEKDCGGEYTGVQVYIDGTHVRTYVPDGTTKLDLITLLQETGGTFHKGLHTLKLVPVSSPSGSGLVRIRGQIFVQCFIQSRAKYAI